MKVAGNGMATQTQETEFAAFVAIDWADREHVWCLQAAGSELRERGKVRNKPEEMEAWVGQLCQRFANAPIAVALEKYRGSLIVLLSKYAQLHLYPIAPQAAANFRKAFYPSGATDDARDAESLLEMLCQHRGRLRCWSPDTEETRLLQNLVEERRRLVEEKTHLLNSLIAKLKIYFPQMLDWFERLDTGLVYALLQRWPTLPQLQKVGSARLRVFFRKHHCRQKDLIEHRITAITQAKPAITDRAVVQAHAARVQVVVRMLQVAAEGIAEMERQIEQVWSVHPDFPIFDSFPGAGAALAPRLLAAFGSQRERYARAADLHNLSGIAPIREQSGRTTYTHFRYGCPKFLRQTFHEWAGHSIAYSAWARAFYQQQRARGQEHHAAVRALAFKWIRIAFRCWRDRVPYDENIYLASLEHRRSQLSSLAAATSL